MQSRVNESSLKKKAQRNQVLCCGEGAGAEICCPGRAAPWRTQLGPLGPWWVDCGHICQFSVCGGRNYGSTAAVIECIVTSCSIVCRDGRACARE